MRWSLFKEFSVDFLNQFLCCEAFFLSFDIVKDRLSIDFLRKKGFFTFKTPEISINRAIHKIRLIRGENSLSCSQKHFHHNHVVCAFGDLARGYEYFIQVHFILYSSLYQKSLTSNSPNMSVEK